jgi:hypothetical protein
MADRSIRDPASERVAETVRRALSLVGPSEHSIARPTEESPVEDPAT